MIFPLSQSKTYYTKLSGLFDCYCDAKRFIFSYVSFQVTTAESQEVERITNASEGGCSQSCVGSQGEEEDEEELKLGE